MLLDRVELVRERETEGERGRMRERECERKRKYDSNMFQNPANTIECYATGWSGIGKDIDYR